MADFYDYSDESDLTPEDREAIRNHLETELYLLSHENTETWSSKFVDEL